MNKRKKIRISIAIGLLLVIGVVGGKLYMTKQTHNQRVAEMANKLRYEGFETEIVKELKKNFQILKQSGLRGQVKMIKRVFIGQHFILQQIGQKISLKVRVIHR